MTFAIYVSLPATAATAEAVDKKKCPENFRKKAIDNKNIPLRRPENGMASHTNE